MNMQTVLKSIVLIGALFALPAHADMPVAQPAVEAAYSGPSVQDNLTLMDTDKNGFVDAGEVRAHLERLHGKGYESATLDKYAASVDGTSCGTPFAGRLYVSN